MIRILAALLTLLVLGGVLAWAAPPRADLTLFLPESHSQASAVMFRELQSGAATTLLLAAIEGAPRAELARLSRATAAGLRASGAFAFVGDGSVGPDDAEQAFLFRYRYLLSPATRPEAFTATALRPRLEALLDDLRSAAAPLMGRLGFADPTGAFRGLAAAWFGDARVLTEDGAWFAPEGPPRALLLARGHGAGLDAPAQQAAMAAFHAAFEAARPAAGARLLLSGPGVFAAEAAAEIKRDVERVSVAATVLLAGFLFWRFRSLPLLALVAVPLLAAVVAGYAATVAVYGHVHAIALGFGVTMLGVAVDYPILLLTLRRPRESLAAAALRIWPTLRLAALAAAAGLLAMAGSGLPGLVQTALFGGTGLLTAAAATRWLVPALLPGPGLTQGSPLPPSQGLTPPGMQITARPLPGSVLAALRALRQRRGLAFALLAAASAVLLITGGPPAQRDLAALSPVPAAQQALDATLRRQLGAPDVRSLFVIGPAFTESGLLRAAEALDRAVQPLLARGLLGGIDAPSRYLPSPETQRARQDALPDAPALRAALREAARGLPFRETAFDRFSGAVADSRTLPPLDRASLAAHAPTVAARLAPLITRQGEALWAIAPASRVDDPRALDRAVAGLNLPGVLFLDVKQEMERLLAGYANATLGWALGGGVVVLGLLGVGLGGVSRLLAVVAPIGGAVLVALAVLTLAGEAISLFHLAALLLLAGLAIDYSLFLAADHATPGNDAADTTAGAILNCAVSTLLTFGLLSLCETPVLHGIGLTVTAGVAAAFVLACALEPPGPAPRASTPGSSISGSSTSGSSTSGSSTSGAPISGAPTSGGIANGDISGANVSSKAGRIMARPRRGVG